MNFNNTKENIDISCIIWLYSKNGNSTPSKLVKWFPFPEKKILHIQNLFLNIWELSIYI